MIKLRKKIYKYKLKKLIKLTQQDISKINMTKTKHKKTIPKKVYKILFIVKNKREKNKFKRIKSMQVHKPTHRMKIIKSQLFLNMYKQMNIISLTMSRQEYRQQEYLKIKLVNIQTKQQIIPFRVCLINKMLKSIFLIR